MSEPNLEIIRHSLSHILAQAIKELYPSVKLGIGPAIENGFYYDFDFGDIKLSEEDLLQIEKKMKHLIKQNQSWQQKLVDKKEAKKLLKDEPYKLDLLGELADKQASFYVNEVGGKQVFSDMCAGPHVASTKELNPDAFKLTHLAGAYWRGDEKKPMLTRIYGAAFADKKDLDEYLQMLEEAKKRDHRKLGKDLELFIIDPDVGMGLPMWLPKGALIWRQIEDFWYQFHLKNGYQLVRSPHIGDIKMWETSGHTAFFKENMYEPIAVDKERYMLKPMNCPFHVKLYKSCPHSYRELPIRWAESATVYRYEKSGELSGLTRVRGFTQDDAHIICRQEQVKEELLRVVKFIKDYFAVFGLTDYKVYLSLRDPENKAKYAGNDKGWELTQKVLKEVADESGLDYETEEGEAAFYGPKLDFKVKDVLGREWQCSTLQFDFNLPERFDMTFINEKGEEERPYMLHRALMGSFERFMAVLIENYAGAFPVWLAPVQAVIIPIAQAHEKYAQQLVEQMQGSDLRVEMMDSSESLSKRIRGAEMQKIPYMLVVGDKEVASGCVTARSYKTGEQVEMKADKFIERVQKEITEKKI